MRKTFLGSGEKRGTHHAVTQSLATLTSMGQWETEVHLMNPMIKPERQPGRVLRVTPGPDHCLRQNVSREEGAKEQTAV